MAGNLMDRRSDREFQFIALTPAGRVDPAIAIAASRAGALGVLNLEHTQDATVAHRAITELARYTDGAVGLKFEGAAAPLIDALTAGERLPGQISTVILTAWPTEGLGQQVAAWRRRGVTVLVEVTAAGEADVARQLEADGLIAKGHEAGGWVGDETTFILLQRLIARFDLPVWAYGGIGLHSAAACYAAGAAGVVLDTQFALARESRLPEAVKAAVAAMDGSETVCLGADLGRPFRVYQRPGSAALQALEAVALDLAQATRPQSERVEVWRGAVDTRVGWGSLQENVWPLDQAATFAKSLAERYCTVGGILNAMREALQSHARAAARLRPLDAGSPLALSHNTRYPIVQGPMTRVSDRAEFALRVAEGGGLPFLALALMRAPEAEALLEETRGRLGDRPWGVGILGFVPQALRQEQLDVVRRFPPSYALIAGGRPDQARQLEDDGIATYLHVPSPRLLRLFLQDGARRFVFEGRECGGHVGPRSSFVLWNTMVDVLLADLAAADASRCHVLFAGGIHDRLSAAMVATLAAPLAERGARLGVLVGTAYLFTEELVASGAIVPRFQQEALRCDSTVLVESSPGYATRCIPSPFVDVFNRERQRLRQEGRPAEEIRNTLEELNVGRLRIASKGVTRHPRSEQDPAGTKYATVGEDEQHRNGMYMIGQVAALRHRVHTIADLHHDVAVEGSGLLVALNPGPTASPSEPAARPSQIAIVGMSALLPKAKSLREFWANTLNKVEAIQSVPKERWDSDLYYDSDRSAADKIYSKSGGFLDEVPFAPLEFGIPPTSVPSIDPLHLLALVAARDALADAGYATRPFDRRRTSVILGASGGTGDLGAKYLLRSGLPLLFGEAGFEIARNADGLLPKWTEDSFAGLLLNVAAGRIANRFDLGGLNYVVDAACASSLTALHLAVKELETHSTDVVITGGVDTVQNPFGYLCFSKTQALSPSGHARVFDETGDGIVISEGLVMLVLKRLADAERDGDRIYAVVSAVGGSSDGRALGLTAPRPEGQALALERAYAKAGFSPTTVGLFEAHGTGTVVGDRTEATTLSSFLKAHGAQPQSYAIGSVKSMIGHTKATAGVAAVAKVAAALYHKVLPPTLGVTKPNPKAGFGDGPLYVNSETRPWIHDMHDHPRRAAVSAFGFGGTNFHAVLEEYTGNFLSGEHEAVVRGWPSELLLWSAPSRESLRASLESLGHAIAAGARPELRDLAYTLWQTATTRATGHALRLAVVAHSLEDLRQKLASARAALEAGGSGQVQDPRGIYLAETPLAGAGKVAFLFPGQGSQYPNMLRDLAVHFPVVRETFEQTDRALRQQFPTPLSGTIFPPPTFASEDERAQEQALAQTNVAQPALGAANTAVSRLLGLLGVRPDLLAGHSDGEYAALSAAGVLDLETLARLSEARGRSTIESAGHDLDAMAAVRAAAAVVASIVAPIGEVWIASLDSPTQTIIAGTRSGIATAVQYLQAQGLDVQPIAGACASHSPLVESAQRRLAEALAKASFTAPSVDVFSNTTAAPYPSEPEAIRQLLAEHLVRPVRFADEIEAMYAAGARVFVEAGPGCVLTRLAGQVLGQRPHVALAVDLPGRNGLTQLQQAVGQLAAHGVDVQLGPLFAGRAARRLNLDDLERETREEPLPPPTWLVNGSRARPVSEPAGARAPRGPLPVLLAHDREAGATSSRTTLPPGRSSVPAPPSTPARPGTSMAAPVAPGLPPGRQVAPQRAALAQTMAQFQHVMEHFLETQNTVMLTYLQGTASSGPMAADTTSPPSTAHGQPQALVAQMSAAAPAVEPTPAGSRTLSAAEAEAIPAYSTKELTAQLLRIVSERTGYPPETLDLDVDIEAGLGIDSIKRVEILGALQRQCLPPERRSAPEAIEQLTGIKTLRSIIDWFDAALETGRVTAAGEPAARPVARAVVEPSQVAERGAPPNRRGTVEPPAQRLAVPQPTPNGGAATANQLPLLHHATFSTGAGGAGVEVVRSLDPSVDLYLADHKLDGKPVFPFAMAMELMAETVQRGWPDLEVTCLRDMQVLKGVVLEDGPKKLRVIARPMPEPVERELVDTHVRVEIVDGASGRVHYRAAVELAGALPPAPQRHWGIDNLQRFPMSVAAAYDGWLFHGPLFQGIARIEGISPEGLAATCTPSTPTRCLSGDPGGQWLIDPVVFDSALQMIILWIRHYTDATPLPSRFSRYRRFGPPSAPEISCYLLAPGKPPGPMFSVDVAFVADGRTVGILEGMECPSSQALNRLVGRR